MLLLVNWRQCRVASDFRREVKIACYSLDNRDKTHNNGINAASSDREKD